MNDCDETYVPQPTCSLINFCAAASVTLMLLPFYIGLKTVNKVIRLVRSR